MTQVIAFRSLLSNGDAGYEEDPEGLQMAAIINSHLPDSIRVSESTYIS
jgi:hypothetical protein